MATVKCSPIILSYVFSNDPMTEEDNDIGFIIRFFGDKCVGKTNLINLLVYIDFEEEYFSTFMPCYTRSCIDNQKIICIYGIIQEIKD